MGAYVCDRGAYPALWGASVGRRVPKVPLQQAPLDSSSRPNLNPNMPIGGAGGRTQRLLIQQIMLVHISFRTANLHSLTETNPYTTEYCMNTLKRKTFPP